MKAEEGCLWIVKVRIHIWLIWEGNLLFFGIFYETRFRQKGGRPEIDISVSKLLGFETFANFLRVSVLISENLVSENLVLKKVSVSVLENLVSEKSLGFGEFGLEKCLGFGF